MLVDAEKAKEKLANWIEQMPMISGIRLAEDIRAADLSDCRLSPPRDDLEKAIVLSQDEIDALEWTWGMGDLERALQNLELERRTLSAQVAELRATLALNAENEAGMMELLRSAEGVIDSDYGSGVRNGYWPTIAPVLNDLRMAIGKTPYDAAKEGK